MTKKLIAVALSVFLFYNDSVLGSSSDYGSFFDNLEGSNIDKLNQVEHLLYEGNWQDANTMLADIEPTTAHAVETNYKNYYSLYSNYLALDTNEVYSAADSTALFELANLCPSPNGACVHQARALYQAIYSVNINYMDCGEQLPSERKQINQDNSNEEPKSQILTEAFEVRIFPNPVNSELFITSKNKNEELKVFIKDLTGRVILTKELKTNNHKGVLDVDLINRAYIVTIINSRNETIVKKLLVAK